MKNVDRLQSIAHRVASRQAGDLRHFMKPEIEVFEKGLSALVGRLKKVVDTLNPQDPAHEYLDPTLKEWEQIKENLEWQLEDFYNVEI